MSQQELLKKVIAVLNSLGIELMVSGSYASSLQGEPRSTHGIDLVISIDTVSVDALIEAFPATDFYLTGKKLIIDAIRNKRMFNLIDGKEGDKVDFWMLTNQPFDLSRFSRKYEEHFLGIKIPVSAPEGKLDLDYLQRWSQALAVDTLWQRLLQEARPESQ